MNLLEEELYRSFLFFYNEANHDLNSLGYGLILDDTKTKNKASIASVGFGLSAYVIGVENHYISYEEGKELVLNTFQTFLHNVEHFNGFFHHFLEMETAKPYKKCEYSTIDTVIFFNGAITCDAYFDEPEIHQLFQQLFQKLNFEPFITTYHDKLVVRMAYNPNEEGDYRGHTNDPWIYQWHMYAEQLSMYFLVAATDHIQEDTAQSLYNGFIRETGRYKQFQYVYCPTNALFVYQYSHAWLDFRNLLDLSGFDWYENSRIATLANREYCIDHQTEYPILNKNAWGLTACLTPEGYRNQCIEPNNFKDNESHVFGVLPPSGAIGSLPFAPKEVMDVLGELEAKYMDSFKEYGFTDGIAPIEEGLWISNDYIGINKGITVLMIDNYLHGTTWKYYMKHPLIQKAIQKLGFQKKVT